MEAEDERPTVRSDVSWSDVADGAIVFDSSVDKIHTLNTTAAYVWILADGTRAASEIATEISRLSGEPLENVSRDVRQVLGVFRRENLLCVDDGSA